MSLSSCTADGCAREHQARGYCLMHYKRFIKYGNANQRVRFTADDPNRPPKKNCEVPECCRHVVSRGLCSTHSTRLKRSGDIHKGHIGKWKDGSGYIIMVVPDGYPGSRTRAGISFIYEHRYVMQETIARPLLSHENVHHKNGTRSDNRSANLELWSRSQPFGQRVIDKVTWAKEIIALYGHMHSTGAEHAHNTQD